jgi:hypothetical protein
MQRCVQRCEKIRPDKPAEILPAAYQRDLGDDTFHPPVNRSNDENVTAAVARAPDSQTFLVGLLEAAGEGDRV